MGTLTDQELRQVVKDDITAIFQDYSIAISFEDVESGFEDGTAFEVAIMPKWTDRRFTMTVEIIEQLPSGKAGHIEFGEGNWEEIDDETIWRWLFMQAT